MSEGLAVVKSTTSKVHLLSDVRYARTLCGLRDEFEWCWPAKSLDAVDCRRCLASYEKGRR